MSSLDLVKSPHFRWMSGMYDSVRCMRIVCVFDDGTATWAGDERLRNHYDLADSRPDLGDIPTRGCFAFDLLPKAWGPDADVSVYQDGSVAVEVPFNDPVLGPCRKGVGFRDVAAALLAAPAKG